MRGGRGSRHGRERRAGPRRAAAGAATEADRDGGERGEQTARRPRPAFGDRRRYRVIYRPCRGLESSAGRCSAPLLAAFVLALAAPLAGADGSPFALDLDRLRRRRCATSPAPRPATASRSASAGWSCARPRRRTSRWPGRGSRSSIRRSSTASPAHRTFCLAVSNTRILRRDLRLEGLPLRRRRRDLDPTASRCRRRASRRPAARSASPATAAATATRSARRGGVWRSRDDGRSWDDLDIRRAKPATYDRVACPRDGDCVAVGGEGDGIERRDRRRQGDRGRPARRKSARGSSALACDTDDPLHRDRRPRQLLLDRPPGQEVGRRRSRSRKKRRSPPSPARDRDVCVGLSGADRAADHRTSASRSVEWRRRPTDSLNLKALDCVGDACVASRQSRPPGSRASTPAIEWDRVNEVAKFDAIQCPADASATPASPAARKTSASPRTGGKLWSEPLSGVHRAEHQGGQLHRRRRMPLPRQDPDPLHRQHLHRRRNFEARRPTTTDPPGTDAQTCITKDICVGINEGVVYTTFDGAVTDWGQTAFPGKATAVACLPGRTDPAVCVATTREFLDLGTMVRDRRQGQAGTGATPTPTRGGRLEGGRLQPRAASAPRSAPKAMILTSDGKDLMHWNETILPSPVAPDEDRPMLKSVACPADGDCLVGGGHGANASSPRRPTTGPTTPTRRSTGSRARHRRSAAFGCESAVHCVAVGGTSWSALRKPTTRGGALRR